MRALRPYVIRLSDEVLSWLDAHRGGEPRVVLIRSILRDHIRRQARAACRAEARARSLARGGAPPAQADLRAEPPAGGGHPTLAPGLRHADGRR